MPVITVEDIAERVAENRIASRRASQGNRRIAIAGDLSIVSGQPLLSDVSTGEDEAAYGPPLLPACFPESSSQRRFHRFFTDFTHSFRYVKRQKARVPREREFNNKADKPAEI